MLGYYLNNDNQIKRLLSEEELHELFLLSKQGDYNAQQKIFQNNIRLVKKIISLHFNYLNNEEKEDAFQIGCIGLWNAVRAFNPELKVKFSSYAYPTILGEIKNGYRFGTQLHVPITIQNLYQKIIKIQQEYLKEGIEIDNQDLANLLNVTEEEICLALNSKNKITSLSEPIKKKDSSKEKSIEEIIPDTNASVEEEIDNKIFIQDIEKMINKLEYTEREIIKMSFGIGCERKSQKEISVILNISKNKITGIKKKALLKLKKEILKYKEITEEFDISSRVKKTKEKKTYKLKSPKELFEEFPNYSKEQILEAINFLYKDNKRALTLVYNLDQNETRSSIEIDLELNNITKNIRAYIYTVKKQLQNILENGPKPKNNFFDSLKDYSESQVLEAVDKLTQTDKEIIFLKYGLNGNDEHTNKEIGNILNIERNSVRKILERIKKNIKKYLQKPELTEEKRISFFDKYPEYTREQVINEINTLDTDDRQLIEIRYGLNGHNYTYLKDLTQIQNQHISIIKKKINRIQKQIKQQLKNKHVKKQILKESIFEIFSENSETEVLNAIETLDSESRLIIKLRYGLENQEPFKFTEIEKQYNIKNVSKKVYKIIRQIKKLLERDTIFQLYPNYSEEQIIGTISTLSRAKRELIEKRYGLNGKKYTTPQELAKDYKTSLGNIRKNLNGIRDQINRRLEKGKFKRETIYELFPNYNEEHVLKVVNTLKEENKKIIEMKFGLNANEFYDLKEISEILKIDFKKLNSRYNQILKAIENRLQKGILEPKTIFAIFSDYTEKEILGSISALPYEERILIEKRYGLNGNKITSTENLGKELNQSASEISKEICNIRKKIQRNLKNGIFKEKSIFDNFPEYTEEEVLKAIETLKQENKIIIKLRFGLDGNDPIKAIDIEHKYNIQRVSARVHSILEQIKKRLKQGKLEETKIYNYFPQYSKEQILGSISALSHGERILIEKRYGLNDYNVTSTKNLGKEFKKSSSEISVEICKIRNKIQKNLENGILEPTTIFQLFPEYRKEEVLNVIETLKPESQFLIKLRYGLDGEESMKAIDIEHKYNIPLVSRKIFLIRQLIGRRLLKEKIKAEYKENSSKIKNYKMN